MAEGMERGQGEDKGREIVLADGDGPLGTEVSHRDDQAQVGEVDDRVEHGRRQQHLCTTVGLVDLKNVSRHARPPSVCFLILSIENIPGTSGSKSTLQY